MTGEEMEIMTGNSHVDQVEDIDIDLNYTSGQMDDDMILGDYDEAAEAGDNQHPEEGDEQMAEGDDASYGMIDADEIDYNDVTDPANDPDTEIGGVDDHSWQLESTAMVPEPSVAQPSVDEVDFAIVAEANDVEVQDATEIEGEIWPEGQDSSAADIPSATAPTISTSEVQIDPSNAIETVPGDVDAADVSKGESSPAATNNSPVNEGDSTAPQEQIAQQPDEYEQPLEGHQEEPQGDYQEGLQEEYQNERQEEYEEGHHEEHHEEYHEEQPEEFSGIDQEFDENNQGQDGAETAAPEVVLESDKSNRVDHAEEAQAADEWSGEDLGISNEVQAGDDSLENVNHTEQQTYSQNHDETVVAQSSSPCPSSASAEGDDAAESKAVGPLPHPQITATEDSSAIAARYDIVVQYGDSDYQLFAKSTEDDPNRYFLSDRSTLDLPLAEFLLSIREVIAQELSPLDELVMHIDGLGVEFAETTTRDFIERYTFGEMLVLYDNLASNDGSDFKPDIHIVLSVKPNCSQRLAALVDQANSGRGLSDVAHYRESPRLDDDFDEDFEEYEEDEALATIPEPENDEYHHDDADGDVDNDQQTEEQKAIEYTENNEQDQHSDYQEVNGQSADIAELSEEDGAVAANVDDDLLNDNDDVDHGPTQQGQLDSHEPQIQQDVHDDTLPAQNGQGSDASSHNTSVTATVNGDDQDEIDYSEDDDDDGDGKNAANSSAPDDVPSQETAAPTQSQTVADDEITWESEDEEDAGGVAISTPPKTSAQVSPATGKRARSASNVSDDEAPPSAKPRLS
ncbi:hypothetical protein PG995_011958 [Apiospora arundinis]